MRIRSLLTLFLAALPALPATTGAAPSPAPIPVSGLVQGPDGAPVEAARVVLIPLVSLAEQGRFELAGKADPEPVASVSTGADGRFRVIAPGAGMWKVAVQARGMVPQEKFLSPLTEETELAAVRLERDAGLEVRVSGADGKPLSGARVRVSGVSSIFRTTWSVPAVSALTDARGVAVLPRSGKERRLVQAGAAGLPFAEEKDVRSGSVALKLPGAVAREIRVLDPTGKKPVAGALVRVGESRWSAGVTSGDGGFAVPLAAGRRERFLVLADDGSWLEGWVEPLKAEEKGPKTFRLPRLESISGRVVSALDGKPVAGAFVWIWSDPGSPQRSGADGGWRVRLPAGEFSGNTISAAAPGYLKTDASVRDVQAGRPGPTLALEPAVAVAGVVVDEKGQPVEGVEVRAAPQFDSRMRMSAMMGSRGDARTAASGRFRVGGLLTELTHELRLTKAGFVPARAEVPPLEPGRPAADLRIVLQRGRAAFGRILDQSEQPIAGAEVVLRPASRRELRMRWMRLEDENYAATADAAGRFEVRDLPAGTFELTARGSGYAPLTVPGLTVPEGGGATDLGIVMLAAGTALEGYVVDPKGQPIAGAEIFVEDSSDELSPAAFSGEDGFFRVEDRRAGELVDLSASRKGYAATAADRVHVPAEPPLRLVLQPSATIEGRTIDPDGRPVPGARVSASPGPTASRGLRNLTISRSQYSVADEDGFFRLENVFPGGVELAASAPGRQEAWIENLEVRPGQDLKGVELVLAPGAVVEGRVLSPSGQPVIGAQVGLLESSQRVSPLARFSFSDGDGHYRLEAVPPGTQNVEAEHKSYRRAVREIEVRAGENLLDLRLEGGVEIAGRVVDDGGAPVPNAWVFLRDVERSWVTLSAASGPDGSFTLTGVADGTYRLTAEKPGFASQEGEDVTVAGSSLGGMEVKLSAGGAIVGQLLGLDFPELSQVRVRLLRGFGSQGQVSADGSYRIEHVAPGEQLVVASLPDDLRQAQGSVTLEPGVAEARLDLSFREGLMLTGRVLRNGEPYAGRRVRLLGGGSADRWSSTDHEGRFRFAGLAAGRYHLQVHGSRIESTYTDELEITADRDVVIELRTVAVSGRLVDSANQSPIHNARVTLFPLDHAGSYLMETATDARGRFRFGDVPAGSWRLRVDLPGYAPGAMDLQVADSPVDGIELSLQAASGASL